MIFPNVCHPSCTPADKLAVAIRRCARHCPVPATSGSVSTTTSRQRQRLYQNKTSWYRYGLYNWPEWLPSFSIQNVSATGSSATSNSTCRVTPPNVHATPQSRHPTFTPPHVPQDINQGMSPPDTLVGCQLMKLINVKLVKLDHFSCCERSYRTKTLSNYHKNTFPTSQKKHGSPLQKPITVCCLWEK